MSDTCSALFIATATIDSIPVNDPFQFSTVAIEYTSTDGTVYRSDLSGQSQQSGFIITKVEPFDRNANDEATLKLTVQFVCTVYEVSGPGQVALNGSGVIAIAYPD